MSDDRWVYTALGTVQAALWGLGMLLARFSFSSAPVSLVPHAAYFPVLAVAMIGFVGLGILTDRAMRSCEEAALEVAATTRIQAAAVGLLFPLFVVVVGTTYMDWHPTFLLFSVVGIPLAGVLAGLDRWGRVVWRSRGAGQLEARRAGMLGIASSLAWTVIPAGPLVGEALVQVTHG